MALYIQHIRVVIIWLTSVDGGDTHRQYMRHGYYSYAYFYLRNASSGYNYYRWNSYGEPNSILLTGQPVDIGQYFKRMSYSGGGGLTGWSRHIEA